MTLPDRYAPLLSFSHAAVGVALFGIVVSTVPLLSQLLGVPVICGPFVDCMRILDDPGSRIGDVPVAAFGVLAFAAALALVTQVHRSGPARWSLLTLATVGLLVSLALQWAVHRRLGLFCPWCLGAAAAMVMLAVIAGFLLARSRWRQPVRLKLLWIGCALAVLFVSAEMLMMFQARSAIAP